MYIDNLVDRVRNANAGCIIRQVCVSIVLYADDIVLIAPSISALQKLVQICEDELCCLDMQINAKKSSCIRIGPRCRNSCVDIMTTDGSVICWSTAVKYLGVFIEQSTRFKCSFSNAKLKFYRSTNAIFSKIGRLSSEEVLLNLVEYKCLPMLLYATEACPMNKTDIQQIEFPLTRLFMKLFRTSSVNIVKECQQQFNFKTVEERISMRKANFIKKLCNTRNFLCCLFATSV